MSLSTEDRKKCRELWKWATGFDEPEEKWNEEAANLLAQMYAEIITCSNHMNYVPRPTGKPSYLWLLGQVFGILKRTLLNHNRKAYVACVSVAANLYRSVIEEQLAGS